MTLGFKVLWLRRSVLRGVVGSEVCVALPCLYNLPFGLEYTHDCDGALPLGLADTLNPKP